MTLLEAPPETHNFPGSAIDVDVDDVDLPAWMPVHYTKSLTGTEDFDSLWTPEIEMLVQAVWYVAFTHYLETWQCWLIRHMLEVYPEGHRYAGTLRFRHCLVTMGRQNGKTEIAAAFGLVLLLVRAKIKITGIAGSVEQAGEIYDRVARAINSNPELKALFKKATDTRGIVTAHGGKYKVLPAKAKALQGHPHDVALVDEVHILAIALWSALNKSMGGRVDSMLAGITTAGDQESALLRLLTEQGQLALTRLPVDNKFGYFVWQANEARLPDDEDELWAEMCRANPSCASGRRIRELAINDSMLDPDDDRIRYDLNRDVNSNGASLYGIGDWLQCVAPFKDGYVFPEGDTFFGIDRDPDWHWATITRSVKTADGNVHTRMVASIAEPTTERLLAICQDLYDASPIAFVGASRQLKDLWRLLKAQGYPVRAFGDQDEADAAKILYARVKRHTVVHFADEELTDQIPHTKRKNTTDGFKIVRDSADPADSVYATAFAVYAADSYEEGETY